MTSSRGETFLERFLSGFERIIAKTLSPPTEDPLLYFEHTLRGSRVLGLADTYVVDFVGLEVL